MLSRAHEPLLTHEKSALQARQSRLSLAPSVRHREVRPALLDRLSGFLSPISGAYRGIEGWIRRRQSPIWSNKAPTLGEMHHRARSRRSAAAIFAISGRHFPENTKKAPEKGKNYRFFSDLGTFLGVLALSGRDFRP
jgi:hypothetical protein